MINIQLSVPIVGIYKITSPSGKIYIGQSVDIQKRFKHYKQLHNCKNQIKLYNSFQKYSSENHEFKIIEECILKQLNERERYWQDYYNTIDKNGLNCKLTGTNNKSGLISKEYKDKISKSMIGKNTGPRSEEVKQKISKSSKGKNTGFRSEEIKQKISKSLNEKYKCGIYKNKSIKPIIQYDKNMNFIKEWPNGLLVIKELKIQVNNALKGRQKTAGGFIWKYKMESYV